MNQYIATKIALLDIEACHPCVCSPSAQPCKEICRSCAHVMLSCTVRVRDALPEMLMSDSKVWSKKKRKTPSSLKISTPFRRSASALFSSHRLQLECPNPTSASRGSEQNQKG